MSSHPESSPFPDKQPLPRLDAVSDLVEIAGRLRASSVIVPGGDRLEDLQLVEAARDHGIIKRIILVGHRDRLAKAVAESGIEIDSSDIVPVDSEEEIARATVAHIRKGDVDIVLKGNISTPIINRHMLPLAERSTVTLASVFDAAAIADGRPMILTDPGVTTVCNFGRMVDLIQNAVDVAHWVMGIARPRVAILSANEKQIPSLPSTWMGLELARRQWSDAVVCGPLSFDLATAPESVAIKGMPDLPGAEEVAGKADILVCPGIDAANVLYKAITAMTRYGQASIAGITVGFPIPYVILSRADTLETRLDSVALCSIYAQRRAQQRREETAISVAAPGPCHRVLAVNPGSTSLKVAVFENDRCLWDFETPTSPYTKKPPAEQLEGVRKLRQTICEHLKEQDVEGLDAVSGRGGFLPRPPEKLPSGTYQVAEVSGDRVVVNQDIVDAVLKYPERSHASNLGAPLAAELARHFHIPAFVVDPVVVDEFDSQAEISGFEGIERRSTAHILSVRMAMKRAARDVGRPMDQINLVVAHLGGGITIATVRRGKIVDNNIGLLGEGPFTPCRAGQLPLGELIDICYSGRFTRDELVRELTDNGGLRSYLGEHRMEVIEKRIAEGDALAERVVAAMVYQIGKGIGAAYVAAGCDVEAIVLMGGLMRSELIRNSLRKRVGRLAPILVYRDSLEMEALATGAVDVLSGRVKVIRYQLPQEGRLCGGLQDG